MDGEGADDVVVAWRAVLDDLAELGRTAVTGARAGAADHARGDDPLGSAVSAGRGAVGALGTSLADEGRAGVIGREIEAALKVSLDRAGALLTAAAERLRGLDEA
ncbi:MAG: hypothetical protein K1X95_02300 [Acidimicrobiia bacterium]|nr:hypothetical protein [Acidimicrobiia bacterium]